MDKLRLGKQTEARKDFVACASAAKREQIKTIFATGEKLKYFFLSCRPDSLGERIDDEVLAVDE